MDVPVLVLGNAMVGLGPKKYRIGARHGQAVRVV